MTEMGGLHCSVAFVHQRLAWAADQDDAVGEVAGLFGEMVGLALNAAGAALGGVLVTALMAPLAGAQNQTWIRQMGRSNLTGRGPQPQTERATKPGYST